MPAFEVATFPTSVIVVRLLPGEELLQSVAEVSSKLGVRSGLVIAIGGLKSVEVGVFKGSSYETNYFEAREGETIELTSAIGSVAQGEDGKPSIGLQALSA